MQPTRKKVLLAVLLTLVTTVVITLLLLNLNLGERMMRQEPQSRYAVQDSQFRRTMGTLLGPPLRDGNRLDVYQNGDQIFPAMLAEIRQAQRTVNFETYIYWSGKIGREFAEALAERARQGVKVRVLIDWVGGMRLEHPLVELMRGAGVQVVMYRPLHWYTLSRFNNRTHRKLLVVDGKVGFTGGVGIADEWLGNGRVAGHWRDSHYRLEGPAVAEMQAAFLDNWMETTGEVLHDDDHFPPLEPVGEAVAQVFNSSPGAGSESVQLMYLLSIAAAKKSIRISNAYFVPDALSLKTLLSARQRGVHVELVVPSDKIDAETTRYASRAQWGPLLEAGVEIYEYLPALYHCKLMVVDDVWVSVGSTNFDSRSFRLNDEANLNVLDASFAARTIEAFEEDKLHARRVTLEAWLGRPWHERLIEKVASLLIPQL